MFKICFHKTVCLTANISDFSVTFPRKNELPRVGLEPTTLYTLDRAQDSVPYR